MDGFTIAWLLWFAAFGVIEGVALWNKRKDDTLSEHTWNWFKVSGEDKRWTAGRFALLAGMIWLTGHLVMGWWAG